jgi:tellurite resistance protein TehA-like permease
MTTSWLFPFLAPIVAASSGAVTAGVLESQSYIESTVITSYALWSIGVIPAMVLITIYVSNVLQYKMPPREETMSLVLPVGPFGMAAFG